MHNLSDRWNYDNFKASSRGQHSQLELEDLLHSNLAFRSYICNFIGRYVWVHITVKMVLEIPNINDLLIA